MNELTLKEVVSLVSDLRLKDELLTKPVAELTHSELSDLKLLKIRLKIVLDYFSIKDEMIKHILLHDPDSSKGKEPFYSYDYNKKLTYAASPKLADFVDIKKVHVDVMMKEDETVEEDFWSSLTIVKSKILTDELTSIVSTNTIPGEAGKPFGVVKVLNLSKEDLIKKKDNTSNDK